MTRTRWLLMLVVVALTLTGCSSDDTKSSTGDTSTGGSPANYNDPSKSACQGKTLSFIGLDGEGGEKELAAWRKARGLKLDTTSTSDWSQQISAIKVGQSFDIATFPYHQAQRMIAAGVAQPLDLARIPNFTKLFTGLRENPGLRGPDGEVYGVPIAWGDGPYVYNPATVPNPPTSITDLMKPEWKDRFVLQDSPDLVFATLAEADGYDDVPLLTDEELDHVADQAKVIISNAAAFNTDYQDATDRLVAGDADLAVSGWEAMLNFAKEKGTTLDYAYFNGFPGGWWDGLSISSTSENVDCAYEYINAMISKEIQPMVATDLVSATVRPDAVAAIDKSDQIYDYKLVDGPPDESTFKVIVPPEKTEDGIANYQAWLDKWQEIKAG